MALLNQMEAQREAAAVTVMCCHASRPVDSHMLEFLYSVKVTKRKDSHVWSQRASQCVAALFALLIFAPAAESEGAGGQLFHFTARTKTRVGLGSAEHTVHLRISLCRQKSVNIEFRGLVCVPLSSKKHRGRGRAQEFTHHASHSH